MVSTGLDMSVMAFREPQTAHLSPRRVSDLLGLTQTELARLIGVARNTLNAPASLRKVDQALGPVVRILAMVTDMAGDEQRAALWFKSVGPEVVAPSFFAVR